MSIFAKKIGSAQKTSRLGQFVEMLKAQANSGHLITGTAAKAALSMESLTDSQVSALRNADEGLSTAIESICLELGVGTDMTAAQKDAAKAAGILAGDVEGFLRRSVEFNQVSTESMRVVATNVDDAMAGRMSIEAYDERENRNAAVYSIAYNMQAARQDEFGETWYPTITVTPDNVGFAITVRLMMVYNELTRSITGAVDNYNKKNIIRAIADPTILKNEQTRIVPVHRAQSADKFVAAADVAPFNMNLEGEVIPTAPLACGVKMSLLGLSQTDALLANGMMDMTDSIDPAIVMSNVYVKVGNDVLVFNTQNLPLNNFNYSAQNNYRLMTLNFDSSSSLISAKTKRVDGSDLDTLAAVKNNNMMVRVALNLSGTCNIETGETVVYGNAAHVAVVQDAAGNHLDLASGVAKDIVDLFASAKVIGYDLIAYRTNANRRQRGQLIDTTFQTQLYNVALRAPITAIHPVTADGQTDAADLQALIAATRVRTSNAAVTALLSAANLLAEYVDVRDVQGNGPDVLGVGRFFVRPTYHHEHIKMSEIVDSIQSHQRAADIQAALVSKIRDYAYRMYRDSEYKAAADALSGGMSAAPVVIIGTDPVIARYLTVTGDLRTLGGEFDVRIVSTLDNRVAGKIFISFGVFDDQRNVAPNPLNFGNMAWSPELTVVLPISRNGQISKETAVQPRFLHINNLPVLTVLTVEGIEDVTNKVALYTKQM